MNASSVIKICNHSRGGETVFALLAQWSLGSIKNVLKKNLDGQKTGYTRG